MEKDQWIPQLSIVFIFNSHQQAVLRYVYTADSNGLANEKKMNSPSGSEKSLKEMRGNSIFVNNVDWYYAGIMSLRKLWKCRICVHAFHDKYEGVCGGLGCWVTLYSMCAVFADK